MIALTALVFVGSVVLFKFVPQQFFPASSRLELMVDMKLAEGASLSNTTDQVKQLEALLMDHPGIENYVAYAYTVYATTSTAPAMAQGVHSGHARLMR